MLHQFDASKFKVARVSNSHNFLAVHTRKLKLECLSIGTFAVGFKMLMRSIQIIPLDLLALMKGAVALA